MIDVRQNRALVALAEVHYLAAEADLAAANAALDEATRHRAACDDAVATAVSDWDGQLAARFAPDMTSALAEIVTRRVTTAAVAADQRSACEQQRDACQTALQDRDAKRGQANELARAAERRGRRKHDERVMATTADQFLIAKGRP